MDLTILCNTCLFKLLNISASERYVLFSDRKRIYSVDIDDPRGPNDPLPLIEVSQYCFNRAHLFKPRKKNYSCISVLFWLYEVKHFFKN